MSAPVAPTPVAVSVNPNREADRVIVTIGDQSFGLTVPDAMRFAAETLTAIDMLRPSAPTGSVQ